VFSLVEDDFFSVMVGGDSLSLGKRYHIRWPLVNPIDRWAKYLADASTTEQIFLQKDAMELQPDMGG